MEPYSLFILNSILFGVGLAMDAFSVSMANGLREPDMKTGRMCTIAGTFAFFQILMPLLGWVCVHTIAEMLYIGGKMLLEGLRGEESEPGAEAAAVGWSGLMLQGIATSIDALSVGFTIAEYSWQAALTEALIIGIVTFLICLAGLRIGKFFGMRLAGKASILGGVILIAIGLEIFLTGVF